MIRFKDFFYVLCPTYKVATPIVSTFHLIFLNPAKRMVAANVSGAGKFATDDGRYLYAFIFFEKNHPIKGRIFFE